MRYPVQTTLWYLITSVVIMTPENCPPMYGAGLTPTFTACEALHPLSKHVDDNRVHS